MEREEIVAVLALQDQAYRLILHLAARARAEPASMEHAARRFASRRGCEAWLREERSSLPQDICPEERDMRAYAQLVWSLFQVSFRIDTMEWDGQVMDAHIVLDARTTSSTGLRALKFKALRSLYRRRGLELPDEAVRGIVAVAELREPLSLWTYVWELRQRARGKAKGKVLARLWHSLPVDVRKGLGADAVTQAIQVLVEAGQGARATSALTSCERMRQGVERVEQDLARHHVEFIVFARHLRSRSSRGGVPPLRLGLVPGC